jgi:putative SOS response-associated peptidase YedK
MCGRYTLHDYQELGPRFKVADTPLFKPSYNIAPSQNNPVIIRQSPNSAKLMKWGLIPFWAKDPRIGFKMINARAETVATSPAFRMPFKKQRCLVPANGFYEWKKSGKTKEPHYIKRQNGELFAMAGLFDLWKDAEDHETWTYTIITTEPNDLMSTIHNRMPVILEPDDEDAWLDQETSVADLAKLLKPFHAKDLQEYVVSTAVNSPVNNSADLIKP